MKAATAVPAPAPTVAGTPAMDDDQIRPTPGIVRRHSQPAPRRSDVSGQPMRAAQKQAAIPETAAAPAAVGGAGTPVPKTELYYWDSCMMVGLAVPPHCDR